MESPETEMLVGNEVGRGAIRIPQQTKKPCLTCKKKKEVTGQEHLYDIIVYEPNAGKGMENLF